MEEIWKPIAKFDNQYEISSCGRIRSVHSIIHKSNGSTYTRQSKILKPTLNHSGYLAGAVSINGEMKPYTIARLVAEAFIPNPENKSTVNHKDGIKTNNFATNLEWMTQSENCQHSFDIGLQKPKRGELNGMAKLTREKIEEIREIAKKGGRYWGRNRIAKELGINAKHLQRIVNDHENLWK